MKFSSLLAIVRNKTQQDACRGVHSTCRREVNRHKLDICILRLRQGRISGIFASRSKFPGLKVGGGGVLISKYGIEIEHMHEAERASFHIGNTTVFQLV